jgi:predicted phage terminase large subunit-like protein
MDCPATVKAVREMSAKWPAMIAKLIEDKANGSAVVQMLAHEIVGILPVNPEGGKVARAAAISPLVEAGNVYLPHPLYAPWVNDFIEECAAFPNGAHDDQVDAMTQALLRWNMVPRQIIVDDYVEPYEISPI